MVLSGLLIAHYFKSYDFDKPISTTTPSSSIYSPLSHNIHIIVEGEITCLRTHDYKVVILNIMSIWLLKGSRRTPFSFLFISKESSPSSSITTNAILIPSSFSFCQPRDFKNKFFVKY